MIELLLFIWQFPQNILGILLINFFRPTKIHVLDNGVCVYYSDTMMGGISLGKYCIVNSRYYRENMYESLTFSTVRHEAIGHTKQSRILGWLYLILIGLPSFLWAAIRTFGAFNNIPYHCFYTEKWADKIANIER